MKDRMGKWAVFFRVIGWIGAIGGIALIFVIGASAAAIIGSGLCSLLAAAVLDWMDGVTEQLIESRKMQEEHLKGITTMIEELRRANAQRSDPQIKRKSEPQQPEAGQYDAQHMADVYRMSQSGK